MLQPLVDQRVGALQKGVQLLKRLRVGHAVGRAHVGQRGVAQRARQALRRPRRLAVQRQRQRRRRLGVLCAGRHRAQQGVAQGHGQHGRRRVQRPHNAAGAGWAGRWEGCSVAVEAAPAGGDAGGSGGVGARALRPMRQAFSTCWEALCVLAAIAGRRWARVALGLVPRSACKGLGASLPPMQSPTNAVGMQTSVLACPQSAEVARATKFWSVSRLPKAFDHTPHTPRTPTATVPGTRPSNARGVPAPLLTTLPPRLGAMLPDAQGSGRLFQLPSEVLQVEVLGQLLGARSLAAGRLPGARPQRLPVDHDRRWSYRQPPGRQAHAARRAPRQRRCWRRRRQLLPPRCPAAACVDRQLNSLVTDQLWAALLAARLPRLVQLLERAAEPPAWWAGRSWRARAQALVAGQSFSAQVYNREQGEAAASAPVLSWLASTLAVACSLARLAVVAVGNRCPTHGCSADPRCGPGGPRC